MDFKRYLEEGAEELDREVERILEEQLKEAEKTDQKLVPLLKAFAKACQGGKRIRGTLVKLGYQIARDRDHLGGVMASQAQPAIIRGDLLGGEKEIIKVAAAYEILHSAILIHDDIIDQSKTRREQPSLYQALGGEHYGVSQAISLADYGFFLAVRIISVANFPDREKNKALELFSKVMMDTAWGEMLDLEKTNPRVVMKLKTACYTISGPLQIGAVLAGTGETLAGRLGLFGEKLGIAYQIQDDILDKEVSYLGSVDMAKKEVEKYTIQAMKIIPGITKDKGTSKILEQMGEYLVRRTK